LQFPQVPLVHMRNRLWRLAQVAPKTLWLEQERIGGMAQIHHHLRCQPQQAGDQLQTRHRIGMAIQIDQRVDPRVFLEQGKRALADYQRQLRLREGSTYARNHVADRDAIADVRGPDDQHAAYAHPRTFKSSAAASAASLTLTEFIPGCGGLSGE
jgi:hypothetical protein